MKLFNVINNLLTFTLSKALALTCNVFCPNTTTPLPGNVAIGFTLALYKVSLLPDVNFLSALITLPSAPLIKPAGANHGSDEASVNEYTPGINAEAGDQTVWPLVGSIDCNQGQ